MLRRLALLLVGLVLAGCAKDQTLVPIGTAPVAASRVDEAPHDVQDERRRVPPADPQPLARRPAFEPVDQVARDHDEPGRLAGERLTPATTGLVLVAT